MTKYRSVGVTSTRKGLNEVQRLWVTFFLKEHQVNVLHHGDCVGGDDELAKMFHQKGTYVIAHPAHTINKYKAKCQINDLILSPDDTLARNQTIVRHSELVLGFPYTIEEEVRSGTWFTIRHAKKLKVPVLVIKPNGEVDDYR